MVGNGCESVLKEHRLTAISSLSSKYPYCHRYTQSGYSVYICNTFPTVESIAFTFFSTGTGSDATEAAATSNRASGTAGSSVGASVSGRDSCPKTVSAGTIAGSVVGGLFILVAGAVGLGYMLRQTRKTAPVPVPVGPLDETKLNNTAPGSPGSPGSANPLFGHFPATQHQQPTTELPS